VLGCLTLHNAQAAAHKGIQQVHQKLLPRQGGLRNLLPACVQVHVGQLTRVAETTSVTGQVEVPGHASCVAGCLCMCSSSSPVYCLAHYIHGHGTKLPAAATAARQQQQQQQQQGNGSHTALLEPHTTTAASTSEQRGCNSAYTDKPAHTCAVHKQPIVNARAMLDRVGWGLHLGEQSDCQLPNCTAQLYCPAVLPSCTTTHTCNFSLLISCCCGDAC
jgi:hypothetical protein